MFYVIEKYLDSNYQFYGIMLRATTRDCPYEKSRFVGAILYGCPLNLMALI
jgi:hypothetical protein